LFSIKGIYNFGKNLNMYNSKKYSLNMPGRYFIAVLVLFFTSFCVFSKSFDKGKPGGHEADAYSVLPFERNENISNWFEIIHKTIDYPYNKYFSGLRTPPHQNFSWGKYGHRLFFHWGFNSNPWSPQIEECVSLCGWDDKTVQLFRNKITAEQARRNKQVMEATARILGFGMSGQMRSYSNGFASIVYDTHILGDYTTTKQAPLQDINSVIDDIKITVFNKLQGGETAKMINKKLDKTKTDYKDNRKRAEKVLKILQEELPSMILTANNGYFKKHFSQKGFRFKK
jgi:hypothetical protein